MTVLRSLHVLGGSVACTITLSVALQAQAAQVLSELKLSDTAGGFGGILDDKDFFGGSGAAIGDLDGDGIGDMVVGAYRDDDGAVGTGAVYVLFLNADGSVKSEQKISDTQGNFSGPVASGDWFGYGAAAMPDVDGDGIPDLAVGAPYDDDGSS